MADVEEEVSIDGKPISSLRVADLKKELKKRDLATVGNKSVLAERLKAVGINQIYEKNTFQFKYVVTSVGKICRILHPTQSDPCPLVRQVKLRIQALS